MPLERYLQWNPGKPSGLIYIGTNSFWQIRISSTRLAGSASAFPGGYAEGRSITSGCSSFHRSCASSERASEAVQLAHGRLRQRCTKCATS